MKSFVAAALCSLCVVFSLAIPSTAGTITGSWTDDTTYEPYQFYGNPEYRDWALWGTPAIFSSVINSTTAYLQKGGYGEEAPPINPTMYLVGAATGPFLAGGTVGPFWVEAEQDYYGGLSLYGEQVAGAGFLITANLQAGESLRVWMMSYHSNDETATITGAGGLSPSTTLTIGPETYGYATFTTSVADTINVAIQNDFAANSTFGQVYVGAAAIQAVQAVPEPATLSLAALGGLPLFAIQRRKKA